MPGPFPLKGLGPLGKLLILAVPGEIPLDSGLMVAKGLSVHGWPSGHALGSEETIRFTTSFRELEDIKCMIETFPLDRANEAFGRSRRHRTFPTKVSDNYIDAMTSGSVRFRAVITME
ncbi:GroES-like protein [Penicillium subrubescens]|uniref:GroES-like protein n=1 Tax=Penicillium subrubescens TaxID=1316194 RepID=UPI002545276A|nr:GroES-like protein [Penicillium subrubescens]KAJ5912234.1 GroES-like protein [Penicillium subrubescens]